MQVPRRAFLHLAGGAAALAGEEQQLVGPGVDDGVAVEVIQRDGVALGAFRLQG